MGREYFGYLGGEWKIIFKWTVKKQGVWMCMAQARVQWWAFMNMTNLQGA
jgi:hypothetical protein